MMSYILLLMIVVPLAGAFFSLLSKYDKNYVPDNVYNVSIWIALTNIFLILGAFSLMDIEKNGIQLVEKYHWLTEPEINIFLGADIFSMLLLFGVNFSFLIASVCLEHSADSPKNLITTQLLFNSFFNGYLLAADLISFYVFFAAMNIPLIMLISIYGKMHKKNIFMKFSLYSFVGIVFLLVAVVMIYIYKQGNIPLNTAGNLNLQGKLEYFVWFSIFLAFISRLPIWPFHYWISSITSALRHPLVFLCANLLPLVGVYGFMRFWPNTVPASIAVYTPYFEMICIVTMIFISFVCYSHRDLRYKIFAYIAVYYLLFLIGVFLPTSSLKMNIGYSLFTFINIIVVLSFLVHHIENEKKRLNIHNHDGILCYMPRASLVLSLFILAAIGLPITPLFWNNFIIISEIFNYNLLLGALTIFSLFIVAFSLLEELYHMKDKNFALQFQEGRDISVFQSLIYLLYLLILLFSFFNPLWFVFRRV